MIRLKWAIAITVLVSVIFVWGVGVGKYSWFPHGLIKEVTFLVTNRASGEFDEFGRLVKLSSKVEVPCPKQTDRTGVLLAFGQSNSANHAQYPYKAAELTGVYNYLNGTCFKAESPLLGATGADGEWISRTAKNLVNNGTYDEVIVVSTGVAGTPIVRWTESNDLGLMLKELLLQLKRDYVLTDIVWHQGESDAAYTHARTYVDLFKSLKSTFDELGVDAPVFVSIASLCGGGIDYPNRVTGAQNALTKVRGIERGVNTDELVTVDMRYDGCHFAKEGQEVASFNLAKIISTFHK